MILTYSKVEIRDGRSATSKKGWRIRAEKKPGMEFDAEEIAPGIWQRYRLMRTMIVLETWCLETA